jgi:lysophospholipase L1-like esterase
MLFTAEPAMATYEIVVLGDSVTWGQGLLDGEKMHNLVAQSLGVGIPNVTRLAHSGAVIGVGLTKVVPEVDGEVPVSYPTIVQQCQGFSGDVQGVDLVIVNGGINDIDFHVIINPLTDSHDLHDLIVQYCYEDMKTLLGAVLEKFSNARTQIVLTSYYPILSNQSAVKLIPGLLLLHGVTIPPFLAPLKELADGRPVANCLQFWTESNVLFQQAVDELNASEAVPRLFFAKVPFDERNAVFAPEPWLWGVNDDFSAEDLVRDNRHASCNLFEKDLIQRETCYRASAGHPNLVGAQQFADSICAVVGKPVAATSV